MLTCPHCNGEGQNFAIMCGPAGGRTGNVKCSSCKGEGRITEAHAERIKLGKRMRRDRIDRHVSQREEATRLGCDYAEWSRIEHGREPETAEGARACALRVREIAAEDGSVSTPTL